jgi:hypothetical protein
MRENPGIQDYQQHSLRFREEHRGKNIRRYFRGAGRHHLPVGADHPQETATDFTVRGILRD